MGKFKETIKNDFNNWKDNLRNSDRVASLIPIIGIVLPLSVSATKGSDREIKVLTWKVFGLIHLVYVPLIVWGINHSVQNSKQEKANDLKLFNQYKTEQNVSDYTKLQELQTQKKEFRGNVYFDDLLKQYEAKHARTVDSIKYVHGKLK